MGQHSRPGRRTQAELDLDRRAHEVVRSLGRALAQTRRTAHARQADVAESVGISRSAYSRMELGLAHGAPIEDWLAAAVALGLVPRFELGRNPREEPVDAGHLAMQELVLRLSRDAGYTGTFELPMQPRIGRHSIDVCLRDPRRRRLVVSEMWNVIGDVGASKRSFDRKLAAASEAGGWLNGGGHEVSGVWVVRRTRRNRQLLARYPEVFASAFPGSSRRWVAALTSGSALPAEPGLVWCDIGATRLFEWRR